MGLGSAVCDACVCIRVLTCVVDDDFGIFVELGGVEGAAVDVDGDEDKDEDEDEDDVPGEDVGGVVAAAAARPDPTIPDPPDPPDRACAPGRSGTAAGPALAKPKFEKSSGAIRLLFK